MSVEAARSHPVSTVLSGPSGGVNGAAFVAHRAGFDRILTFDMGGTSTDVALSVGGVPTITRETRVGPFPVRAPSIEVESIGAGGGSIAHVSPVTGALRVVPNPSKGFVRFEASNGAICSGTCRTCPLASAAHVTLNMSIVPIRPAAPIGIPLSYSCSASSWLLRLAANAARCKSRPA